MKTTEHSSVLSSQNGTTYVLLMYCAKRVRVLSHGQEEGHE